jgi:hypothetical protein
VPASDPPARSLVCLGRLIPAQNRCVRRSPALGWSLVPGTHGWEQRPSQGKTCVRSHGWGAGLVRAARRLSSGVSKGRMTRRYCYPRMASAFPRLPARCRLRLPRPGKEVACALVGPSPLHDAPVLRPGSCPLEPGRGARGRGSHHRAHHRGGSAWRGAPCVAAPRCPRGAERHRLPASRPRGRIRTRRPRPRRRPPRRVPKVHENRASHRRARQRYAP